MYVCMNILQYLITAWNRVPCNEDSTQMKKSEELERYEETIGRTVRVATKDGKEKDGILYCIDPETGDVILIVINEKKAIVVQGHAVLHISVLDKEEKAHLTVDANMTTKKKVKNDKQRTIDILKKNRIPVQENEDGDLRVFGDALTISSPYLSENCVGSNEIILRRVQDLLF